MVRVCRAVLDWNDWFLRKRLKPPLMLVALGTYNDQTKQAGPWVGHHRTSSNSKK